MKLSLILFFFVASSLVVGSLQQCGSPFNFAFMAAINSHRSDYHAPPLYFSNSISVYAQDWANKLAAKGVKEYMNALNYGDNVYFSSTSNTLNGNVPPLVWSLEPYYDMGKEPNMQNYNGWRDFTQMVWVSSRQVGLGCAKTANGSTIVVANFFPKGNILGQYARNVLPPN